MDRHQDTCRRPHRLSTMSIVHAMRVDRLTPLWRPCTNNIIDQNNILSSEQHFAGTIVTTLTKRGEEVDLMYPHLQDKMPHQCHLGLYNHGRQQQKRLATNTTAMVQSTRHCAPPLILCTTCCHKLSKDRTVVLVYLVSTIT